MRARRHFSTRKKEPFPAKLILSIAGVLGVVLLGLLVWGIHTTSVRISDVSVQGAKTISKETISSMVEDMLAGAYAFVIPRNSTFFYPKETIEDTLYETFPHIKEVDIARDGFSGLSVAIAEYEGYALWCGEWYDGTYDSTEQCYFVDGDGYIFKKAEDTETEGFVKYYGSLPESRNPIRQYVHLQNDFKELRNFLELLDTVAFEPVALFWNPDEDYIVYLQQGGELRISMFDDLTKVFESLQAVFVSDAFKAGVASGEPLQYIDLRFQDRVLFKFGTPVVAEVMEEEAATIEDGSEVIEE